MSGFFAIGVHNPKTEANVGTLWRTANIFGAAFIFTVGRRYRKQASDTLKTPRHIPLFHFANVRDLVDHLPQACRLIGVELDATARMSHQYAHPQTGCYLLGAEDNGLPLTVVERCHSLIRLPGERSLNVAVAGSMVIYDRWQQRAPEANAQRPNPLTDH
ncbi:MAG TPA: RNA methyltransferase [Flavobacteriales bacterium]|nr:RNA methyltransferase [Flavobacteriales bacterium]